ncbi:MAG: glycoside hydrolase family 5 protein, partial [Solirubrobacteraceae bacterium]
RHTALDERGAEVGSDQHDVLTGSDDQGRLAFSDEGFPATCGNWTSGGDGIARIGHADRFDAASWGNKRFTRWNGSWASEHFTGGCDAKRLGDTGGSGRFYCFAAEPAPASTAAPAPAPPPPPGGFTFRRGLNVNHWLGDNLPAQMLADSLYGAAWFDEEDVRWIAEHGFDHLRISINGARWINAAGDLDEAALAPFDRALAHAKAHGMGVVLEMKGLPGYRSALRGETIPDAASPYTDEATQGDAAYLWWLVARRYASEGDALRFEVLGGPRAKETRDMLAFNRRSLAAIRRTNPTRIVYLAPREPSPDLAVEVDLPDPYTALTVHFWEPDVFAFQTDPTWPAVHFPGRAPDLSRFAKDSEGARQFSRTELTVALLDARIARFAQRAHALAGQREVYIGSWGVYERADDESARRYIRAVQAALERGGLSWAIYDYHTG